MELELIKWIGINAPSLLGGAAAILILSRIVQVGMTDLRARVEFLERALTNCLEREAVVHDAEGALRRKVEDH
jgi:hypothetical protein